MSTSNVRGRRAVWRKPYTFALFSACLVGAPRLARAQDNAPVTEPAPATQPAAPVEPPPAPDTTTAPAPATFCVWTHQRWLSTPAAVKADKTDSIRDTSTFAIGPRFHFKLSENVWFRPGIALALPNDDPMKKNSYKIAQLDLPFSF